MSNVKQISRRQFLTLSGGAVATALFGGTFLVSGCPLSNSGVCVGPCAAFIDLDRDGICDRIQREAREPQQASYTTPDRLEETHPIPGAGHTVHTGRRAVACPFGLVNDPYPGKCGQYVDADGNGICDLSEEGSAEESDVEAPSPALPFTPEAGAGQTTAPTRTVVPRATQTPDVKAVACPFGLVNDPYPGECRRYRDANSNGICDLSEVAPEESTASSSPSTPTPTATPQPRLGATQTPPAVACPFGLVNDPYPGQCRRYVDRNANGICDLSEPSPPATPSDGSDHSDDDGSPRQRRGRGRRQG